MKNGVLTVVGADPHQPEPIMLPLLGNSFEVNNIADIKYDVGMRKVKDLGLTVEAVVYPGIRDRVLTNPEMELKVGRCRP